MRSWMVLAAAVLVPGMAFAGDAARGVTIFRTQNCVKCHSINGQGGHSAPDLGTSTARDYNPALLATVMWNHAPAMFAAIQSSGVDHPKLSDRDASDLFAYFYSVRFFDKPGDAGRGKQVWTAKHCAECHGMDQAIPGGGKPVKDWQALADPIVLLENMWNHASTMKQAFAAKGLTWSSLTSQDLTDVTLYLRNVPQMKKETAEFSLPDSVAGATLFQEKGCAGCHNGNLALEKRLSNSTLTDIAAAMWNHAPKMSQAKPVNKEEMRQIVSYVWEKQFIDSDGNASRGKRIFAEKKCATCHNDVSGASKMARGDKIYSSITMMSVLWDHGSSMERELKSKNLSWPRFKGTDMADLVAYLNTRP